MLAMGAILIAAAPQVREAWNDGRWSMPWCCHRERPVSPHHGDVRHRAGEGHGSAPLAHRDPVYGALLVVGQPWAAGQTVRCLSSTTAASTRLRGAAGSPPLRRAARRSSSWRWGSRSSRSGSGSQPYPSGPSWRGPVGLGVSLPPSGLYFDVVASRREGPDRLRGGAPGGAVVPAISPADGRGDRHHGEDARRCPATPPTPRPRSPTFCDASLVMLFVGPALIFWPRRARINVDSLKGNGRRTGGGLGAGDLLRRPRGVAAPLAWRRWSPTKVALCQARHGIRHAREEQVLGAPGRDERR